METKMDHPMRPLYEVLAHDLKACGIKQVFGLMSDDTAHLLAALDGLGVPLRGARHENQGVGMAEGHAAATRALSVAVIGRGPALTNALHGMTYAQRTGAPVLVIVGASPYGPASPNAAGPEAKSFPAEATLRGAGFRTFVVTDVRNARTTLAQAIAEAHSGTTVLLLPGDIQGMDIEFDDSPMPEIRVKQFAIPALRDASLSVAVELLGRSRRPLILAGVGAFHAGATETLTRLADHLGAALCTSLKAQDMFRGHPLNCGILGSFSHAGGRRVIDQADCVIAFGASMNHRTMSFGLALPKDIPVIHVDTNRQNIGRWFPADVGIVGDAKQVATRLIESLPARAAADKPLHAEDEVRRLREFSMASEFQPQHTARTVDPRSLTMELDRLLPENRNAVYDVGNFMQVAPYFPVSNPAHVKYTFDFASVGLGFGVALGYACATPDRPTVLFIGDGGLLMTLGELETVVREDIPLIVALYNDCAYGAEYHYLKESGMSASAARFADVDFAPIAAALGFETATIRTMDDLKAAGPLLSAPDGPVFLDCKINGNIAAHFTLENVEQERLRSAGLASSYRGMPKRACILNQPSQTQPQTAPRQSR
jgi:thiamine pyrophosphate-dependent acetolactate synthase large subunit-like protein